MVILFGLLNLASGILAFLIAIYVFRKRNLGIRPYLSPLFFSAAWWNIALFFESLSTHLSGHIFWTAVSYPGNMFAPVFLFLFLYHYTHFNKTILKPVIASLMIIPVLSCIFVWIPDLRVMVWPEVTLNSTPWGLIARLEHGWWYYVEAYSSYALIILGIFYMIRGLSLFPNKYDLQVWLLLIASLIPLILNFIYTLNNELFYGIDLTPVAFTLSSSLFYYIISKHQLLNITPIAWNTIMDNIDDGVIVLVNDKIVGINPSAKKILINSGNDLKEGTVFPEGISVFNQLAGFYQNKSADREEIMIGERYFEVSKNHIKDKSGSVASLIIIFHDITEIKKIEAEIRSINQQLSDLNITKDMLFKVVSHDLRGPVGSMVSYLRMVIERDDPIDKNSLEILYKTAANASFLIENLLYWAISQGKEISLHPAVNLISNTMARALEPIHYLAFQKEITVVNDCEKNAEAYYDAHSMEIVFRNILSNSIKYSYSGKKIEITCSVDNQHLTINFTDYGIGIAENTLKNILKSVVVKSERGTTNEIGTGIGLSLCFKMVKANNGIFNISSEPGKGTTVSITIPASKIPEGTDLH
jgi:signal transduction histidine kinase